MSVPQEVLDVMDPIVPIGNTIRVRHNYRENGDECSKNKDGCMIVQRKPTYWWYYCHRCHAHGRISIENHTPKQTLKLLEYNRSEKQPQKIVSKGIKLPNDLEDIFGINTPKAVGTYLQTFSISDLVTAEYGIAYSPWYERIIFPIIDRMNDNELLGWLGKCYKQLTKQERHKQNIPKWLMRKRSGIDRIYYTCPAVNKDAQHVVVFVEDAISAIAINMAVGCNAVAILNTNMPYELATKYKKYHQVLWLDADVWDTTLKAVKRYNSFGLNVCGIRSPKDPKSLSASQIQRRLSAYIKSVSVQEA